MSDKMRESAEQAYTMTAHDYCSNPVGSRDWTLFWRGWQAALAEQPEQGEAVPFKQRFIDAVNDRNQLHVQLVAATAKAVLWDTLNAALMSRSGITLNNERDCYEAARQWAEAHDDASSYKAAAQKAREDLDTLAALKVEAVTLTAPPAPAVPDEQRLMPDSGERDTAFVRGWNACRGAMLASGGKASVPDGWKLVPERLTPHMAHAGDATLDDDGGMQEMWTNMLAAAPEVKP